MNGKINSILVIVLLVTMTVTNGQAQEWASAFGHQNLDQGTDVAIDGSGNVYLTGFFQGTVDFDPSPNIANLNSAGQRDFFIAKYNAAGQYLWAKAIGGGGHDHARSVEIDIAGNIFISGEFSNIVDFDPGVGFSLHNGQGDADVFVAKYDPQGNFIWAKSFGGTGIDNCRDMMLDNAGNIYLTGVFQGTADFDPNGSITAMSSIGNLDTYILKLDQFGNFLWVKSIQGPDNILANQFTFDQNGDILLVGEFQGVADFDPSAGVSNQTSLGTFSAFFAKYDASNGSLIWVERIAGSGFERAKGVAVDVQDNIYITGVFRGTVDFDNSADHTYVTSAGDQDCFVVKYTPSGDFLWANHVGGAGNDIGVDLEVDDYSNVFISAIFRGTATVYDFQNFPKGSFTSNGSSDIAFLKFDKQGTYIWGKSGGGTNGDESTAIAIDNQNKMFTTGWFQGSSSFGGTTVSSSGDRDILLAKVNMEGTIATEEQETLNAATFNIFPNPSNGLFNLEINDFEGEELDVTILDVTGRVIHNLHLEGYGRFDYFTQQIDITGRVSSGLYFVRLQSGRAVTTQKVFIR